MSIEVCVGAAELRAALADIEQAESRGFNHCLAVMRVVTVGPSLNQCLLGYSDMIERAHPTDGNLSWGRFQGVVRRHRFVDGKLVDDKSAVAS